MALFAFELDKVEEIKPWGNAGDLRLSWLALTFGQFRVNVMDQTLFQYTDEIRSHWGQKQAQYADYQIAQFASDLKKCIMSASTRLPDRVQRLASNWTLLQRLFVYTAEEKSNVASEDLWYNAWRWLGERTLWTHYLICSPIIHMVRIGDDIHIHWDNRDCSVDGIPVWTAHQGAMTLSVPEFQEEYRVFTGQLLTSMEERINEIASGTTPAQIKVDIAYLQQQHDAWRREFSIVTWEASSDIPWSEAEKALQEFADTRGVSLP